VFFGTDPRRR
jgi:hypothetical protein